MSKEVLSLLCPRSGGVYVDGTVGGGGHARLILEASSPDGRLVGLDRDPEALSAASEVLAPFGDRVTLVRRNFSEAATVLGELGVGPVDGILFDLGVSSWQLDTPRRGFSFRLDGPLDMRMGPDAVRTAAEIVNEDDTRELERIFRDYGEERWARRIAQRIVTVRNLMPIETTRQLADLVAESVPGGGRAKIHPATRVFQALRICVNGELAHVESGVGRAIELLKPGGVLAVISFHSLEDRIVKKIFQREAMTCTCPPKLPVCTCGHASKVELLTRRALRPSQEEIDDNPRARSAVLRGVRRCPS